jgi:hypothetical protein
MPLSSPKARSCHSCRMAADTVIVEWNASRELPGTSTVSRNADGSLSSLKEVTFMRLSRSDGLVPAALGS